MLRTPAHLSLRCPVCFSWWAIVLRWSHQQSSQEENLNHGSLLCLHVLPAYLAGDKTWQCFPVVLFWVLGWWLCIPSTHPEKICQFVTWLFLWLGLYERNCLMLVWGDLKVECQFPSQDYFLCAQKATVASLYSAFQLGLSAGAHQAICWHQMILAGSGPLGLSQITQTDELIQCSFIRYCLFYMNCIYNFYI